MNSDYKPRIVQRDPVYQVYLQVMCCLSDTCQWAYLLFRQQGAYKNKHEKTCGLLLCNRTVYNTLKTRSRIRSIDWHYCHPYERWNGHQLSTKWALGSDQSSVRSWPCAALHCPYC